MYNPKMGIRATTIVATSGITGSLFGTASNAITASYAQTAPATLPVGVISSSTQIVELGFASTGSNTFVDQQNFDGQVLFNNNIQVGYVGSAGTNIEIVPENNLDLLLGSANGVVVINGQTASGSIESASYAATASYATNAAAFPYVGDAQISGSLGVTGSVRIEDTVGMTIPVGTTAQRIYPPPVGMIRYNSDLNVPEYYNAGDDTWYKMGQARHTIEYVVVGGGGGGGAGPGGAGAFGAGGGAGGYRSSIFGSGSGGGAASESALILYTNVPYRVTIGAGGAGGLLNGINYSKGTNGSPTLAFTVTAAGGGAGGGALAEENNGNSGGSGGGASGTGIGGTAIGTIQGFGGGSGSTQRASGGGGGAGSVGQSSTSASLGGNGGNGIILAGTGSFTGSAGKVAGGGGAAGATPGSAEAGGGAGGSDGNKGSAGIANTGGGGGGSAISGSSNNTGNGGSGFIRIIHSSSVQMFTSQGISSTGGTFSIDGKTFYYQDIIAAGDNDYVTFV